MATKDWEASVSAKINGPTADQVWPYLSDFGNIYKIFPTDVSFCVQGTEGQPGLIRYTAVKFPMPTDPSNITVMWAREELLELDVSQKYVTYQIHENNRGLTRFTGTMQVLHDGDHGCTFKWSVVSAPVAGSTYEDLVGFLEMTTSQVVSLIEKLV
ncbi:hypothetical protein LIER_01741 [Lithospermum erythrorhizon]|uniref:Lachrymatory-factor synthase n=1 Tax=Lithospermum erythrorhizon TaxID=34254 RepID=A0AAV3NM35_LITER